MSKTSLTQPIVLFLMLGFFWVNLGWSATGVQSTQDASPTPAAVTATVTLAPSKTPTIINTPTRGPTPTLTPLPADYIETPDQTTGILFGAVFLLIIIVGGTFFTLRSRR